MMTAKGKDVPLKPAFEERYRSLLGERYPAFLETCGRFLRKSIRVNTLKTTVEEVKERMLSIGWTLSPVPWCPTGFFAEHADGRLDLGNTVEHALGYYYVQEAASMIPPEILELSDGMLVLDLCAAPGSKSTQIAQLLRGTGMVVCNDRTGARLQPLGMNLQRMGCVNSAVSRWDGRRFPAEEAFDRVLVDAPCSATGAVRKSLSVLEMWSTAGVRRLAGTQRSLLETGWRCLKPGGILVYSTCTLEPEEDEGVVSWFLGRHSEAELLEIDLPLKRSPPVLDGDPRVAGCLRLWPMDNDTEGFFVAKLGKSAAP